MGAPGDEYFQADSRPVILFDGVCNLCNGGVNFMLDWDRRGEFRLAALQSPAGRKLLQRSGRSPDDISSIVLVRVHSCTPTDRANFCLNRELLPGCPCNGAVTWLPLQCSPGHGPSISSCIL
jgi:predicted DCC family thiol-disulfide oxidoreductase YuxK